MAEGGYISTHNKRFHSQEQEDEMREFLRQEALLFTEGFFKVCHSL